jgi:hypothetical protein
MAVVGVATASPASAAVTVGSWQFNERSGAAIDSAGSRQNGTVGSLIQRTGSVYRFPTSTAMPSAPHLVTVAHNSLFNPGTGDFAVQVRLKTARVASNVVQKGQASPTGSYWKVEIHNGQATCLFKGSGGQRAVLSTSRVNNGAWHTIRCDRSSSAVSITIDGVKQRTITGPTGNVANSSGLSIGGKAGCNPPNVGCDFFAGEIDYVRILN